MTIAPRQNDIQCGHFIRFDFAFNSAGSATTQAAAAALMNAGLNFGTLPAGAVVKTVDAYVDVAFNNGTNNTISVGFTATGTDLVSGAALGTQAIVATAVPIAASTTTKAATSKAGTPLYVSTSQTGTAATTGQCTVIVTYYPPI